MTKRGGRQTGPVPPVEVGSDSDGALSFSVDLDLDEPGPQQPAPQPADRLGFEDDDHDTGERPAVSFDDGETGEHRVTLQPATVEPGTELRPPADMMDSVPREESSWRRELAREQPFGRRESTPTRPKTPPGASQAAREFDPSNRLTPSRLTPSGTVPAQRRPVTGPNTALREMPAPAPAPPAPKKDEHPLGGSPGSSLDAPRRLVDPTTGLPSFTSLFSDLKPLVEDSAGVTVLYVHVPSSAIVEERFGWEALEAYRGLIANYLAGYGQDMRRDRGQCVVARAFADDFVIVTTQREQDDQLSSTLADQMTRHLMAIDEETAALLQVYVGVAMGKPFAKVHPERLLYRLIQQSQTQATDVGRQKISANVRILDRCIAGELFQMVYQPIVRMEDHKIFAYEALVRCTQKELRSPHVLFNVAEQGERIWPLNRLLRRMALRAVPNLPDDTQLFLNLHPSDFDDPDIIEPDGPIARAARRVVVEVTERAAILDLDHFRQRLDTLRGFGARIAIDDLGSGYSALNMVTELNPDFIKLDMTLIRSVDESPVRQNLVRNMVAFATDVGATVVAEGVETRPELETLRELGCQLVQGYYLAMPSPPFVLSIQAPPAQPRSQPPAG